MDVIQLATGNLNAQINKLIDQALPEDIPTSPDPLQEDFYNTSTAEHKDTDYTDPTGLQLTGELIKEIL